MLKMVGLFKTVIVRRLVKVRLTLQLTICICHGFGAWNVFEYKFVCRWQLLVQINIFGAGDVSRNVKFILQLKRLAIS